MFLKGNDLEGIEPEIRRLMRTQPIEIPPDDSPEFAPSITPKQMEELKSKKNGRNDKDVDFSSQVLFEISRIEKQLRWLMTAMVQVNTDTRSLEAEIIRQRIKPGKFAIWLGTAIAAGLIPALLKMMLEHIFK